MIGFFKNLFVGEPATADPLPPISLATEAMSALGFHDITRAAALADLRNIREELAANIEAETKALASIDEHLAREELAYGAPEPVLPNPYGLPTGAVLLSSDGAVEYTEAPVEEPKRKRTKREPELAAAE